MKKALLAVVAAGFLIVACSSPPKPPRTVDGSMREPVNKNVIKDQMGPKYGK
ncbi:MAG: hypothetical protein A4E65_03084 [Syntrophorhabdus sp. PtaU1.Bin153]|nr:MAG: hypothetical protein A4E65_03084 [Syntrophorhabdus sp. PtaU1.Bin153]